METKAATEAVSLRPGMYQLLIAVATMRGAEIQLREAVGKARYLGRSWSEIAEALGVTKSAAHQRFANVGVVADRDRKAIDKAAR